jgi:hypothetical protein
MTSRIIVLAFLDLSPSALHDACDDWRGLQTLADSLCNSIVRTEMPDNLHHIRALSPEIAKNGQIELARF